MKIQLARIDDRFIHGQVLTKWVKQKPSDRIIVVSDEVAKDDMRKTLILSVAPSNLKASAVTVDKMARAYKSPKYTNATAILLFENPSDVLKLVELGVDLKELNVGGMRFATNKKQITKAVNVTEEDVVAFRELDRLGVKLDLRQLPSDSTQNFITILDKELN